MPKLSKLGRTINIDGWNVDLIVKNYKSAFMNYEIIKAVPTGLDAQGLYVSLDIIELEAAIFKLLKEIHPEVGENE
jgi:hypothetical protein